MALPRSLAAAALFASLALAAPSSAEPRVTEIRIHKSAHTLELVSGGEVVKTYRVAIGPGGAGPKRMQGDRVTPVGRYKISGRIKNLFHEFLVVSYPNARTTLAATPTRGEGARSRAASTSETASASTASAGPRPATKTPTGRSAASRSTTTRSTKWRAARRTGRPSRSPIDDRSASGLC